MRASYRLFAPSLSKHPLIIVALALGIGVAVAALPTGNMALLLAIAGMAMLTLIEPINGITILLVVAPLKTIIETETTVSLPFDVGQLALLFAIAAWALNRITQRRPLNLKWSAVQVPLLLFVSVTLLSLLNAFSITIALTETLKWVEMLFLVSFCVALYRRSEAHWLVFAIVLAGGVQATIGIYEFMGGSGADHLRILDDWHFRAFGTFGQPNPFGAFMGITLPLALTTGAGHGIAAWQTLRGNSFSWRAIVRQDALNVKMLSAVFYLAMAGLILGGLITSWSRGAWMGLAGSAGVMLLFTPRSAFRGFALVAIILVLVLVVWGSGLLPTTITARMSGFVEELTTIEDARGLDITNANYAVTERIAHWQAAVMMAEDHPWLGVGFGSYEAAYPTYALLNWPYALGHAHNYYLNLLAEVGVIGFLTYLITWGTIFVLTVRLWRRSKGLERAWSVGLLGVWSYMTIHNAVDKLYVNNMFLHLGCMLGLLAILRAENQTSQ